MDKIKGLITHPVSVVSLSLIFAGWSFSISKDMNSAGMIEADWPIWLGIGLAAFGLGYLIRAVWISVREKKRKKNL